MKPQTAATALSEVASTKEVAVGVRGFLHHPCMPVADGGCSRIWDVVPTYTISRLLFIRPGKCWIQPQPVTKLIDVHLNFPSFVGEARNDGDTVPN